MTQDLKKAKLSQMNFYQNSILMKNFNEYKFTKFE